MRANPDNRLFLGVCAGVAEWLDVPAALVRIVFVVCVLVWPMMAVGYFAVWFCMDRSANGRRARGFFGRVPNLEHFRTLNYHKPICKNKRDRRIAGVCAGLADYLEVSHFAVRLLTVLSLFVLGPFTVWAYIICWIVFEPDPRTLDEVERERRRRRRERRAERRTARRERRRERRRSRNAYRNDEDLDGAADPSGASGLAEELGLDDLAGDMGLGMEDLGLGGGEKARKTRKGRKAARAKRAECIRAFGELEMRLRDIEAFVTSRKFRLHCEIKRI